MKYEVVIRITMKKQATKKFIRDIVRSLVRKTGVEKVTVREVSVIQKYCH